MRKHSPVRLALLVLHGRVDGVRDDRGIGGVICCIERLVIAVLLEGDLEVLKFVSNVVISIVLITQRGIHQNTTLNLCRRSRIFHAVADQRSSMFGGTGNHQTDGLSEGQIIHRPLGDQHSVNLGHCHCRAARVLSAKDIFSGLSVPGHLKGGEGGVVLIVLIYQITIVIGLVYLITFHGADTKAAVLRGDCDFDIAIVQLISSAQILLGVGDQLSEVRPGGRRKACHHGCCQKYGT